MSRASIPFKDFKDEFLLINYICFLNLFKLYFKNNIYFYKMIFISQL